MNNIRAYCSGICKRAWAGAGACLFLFWVWGGALADSAPPSDPTAKKRDAIRHAIDAGIVDRYEIPFSLYIRLGMWAEIDRILRRNNHRPLTYTFPGRYYSRPYRVNNTLWVFDNAGGAANGEIFIFVPETLGLIERLQNPVYARYDGGIREVVGDTVISAGSDQDMDTAVIWDTRTHFIRTLGLQDGHYIFSLDAFDQKLFMGSCGGKVHVWDLKTLGYLGDYATSDQKNTDWEVFNQKECIRQLNILDDRLIGVGERHLFVWDLKQRKRLARYPKSIPNAELIFYQTDRIEYKGSQVRIQDLNQKQPPRELEAKQAIADLVVSDAPVLHGQRGPVLVLSLRHNKGISFYDYHSLKPLRRIAVKGENLCIHDGAVFATDDRHLYKYHLRHEQPEKYQRFLESLALSELILDPKTYQALLKRARQYPEALSPFAITERYLSRHGLKSRYSFQYGKIGERYVQDEQYPEQSYTESLFGYKLVYEMANRSDQCYLLTVAFEWEGAYGQKIEDWKRKPDVALDEGEKSHRLSFFIPPDNGGFRDIFPVGEKEPKSLFIRVQALYPVSSEFYQGFQQALDPENQDLALVQRYLTDDRLSPWHPELKRRKQALEKAQQQKFWLFRFLEWLDTEPAAHSSHRAPRPGR